MIKFSDLKPFEVDNYEDYFALVFLGYYISNGAYYMDDFHFDFEL